MKTKLKLYLLFIVWAYLTGIHQLAAQGTAFQYQGRLNSGGNPANGSYDLTFNLYTVGSGGTAAFGPLTQSGTAVSNGQFSVTLDFGAGVFNGTGYWLDIAVRTNGVGTFTSLTPRQPVTPTPYAIYAAGVNAAGLTGTVPLAQLPGVLVTNNQPSVTLSSVTVSNVTLSGKLVLPDPAVIYFLNGSTPVPFVDCDLIDVYLGQGAGLAAFYPGVYNTGIGGNALRSNVTGANNTAVGYSAMSGSSSTGNGNAAVGYATMANNISGSANAAIGEEALYNNLNGGYNTANGYEVLYNNQTGANNTADGASALFANKTGNNNVAGGYEALYAATTNSNNTADGYEALWNLTGGGNNLALGYEAGYGLTTGSNNIYLGNAGMNETGSMRLGTPGIQSNTYIAGVINGDGGGLTNLSVALLRNSGTGNFFAGQSAGNLTLTGQYDAGVGEGALGQITSGSYNAAFGVDALAFNNSGSNNVACGANALTFNQSGYNNTAVGIEALYKNTSASYNTAIGAVALFNNTLGSNNVASGYNALNANTGGSYNTAAGGQALFSNLTGNYNTAVGDDAMKVTVGNDNAEVAIGYQALENDNAEGQNTGSGDGENTAIGYQSLRLDTTGAGNTAIGYQSLNGNANGAQNTAIGDSTLLANLSGNHNTVAGYQAMLNSPTPENDVAIGIGTFQNATEGAQNTALGAYAFQNTANGDGNIGIGYNAGHSLNAGNNNIYIGNAGASAESGIIRIGTPGTQTATYLAGTVSIPVLMITGGSDLAEPFPISPAALKVSAGSVVVIDVQHPGQLKLTDRPYDTRVAGVVSGANGINPGIQMHQEGLLEGGRNVALTGRVYVQADASNGAIEPGDLLTTSSAPGRAMRVTDHLRAQGAILGKAMTGLSEGNGMVLVLVTLQ